MEYFSDGPSPDLQVARDAKNRKIRGSHWHNGAQILLGVTDAAQLSLFGFVKYGSCLLSESLLHWHAAVIVELVFLDASRKRQRNSLSSNAQTAGACLWAARALSTLFPRCEAHWTRTDWD